MCIGLALAAASICPSGAQTHSKKELTKLEQRLNESVPDTNRVQLLNQLSREYNSSEVNKSLAFIKQALLLSLQLGYKKGEADSYAQLAKIKTRLDNGDSVRILCQKAIQIQKELRDKSGLATSYLALTTHYTFLDDFPKAIDCNDKAFIFFKSAGDKRGIANAYTNYGMIHLNQNDYLKALPYFQKAEAIYEEIHDLSGQAAVLNNIGILYGEQQQIKLAQTHFEKALGTLQQTDDHHTKARTHNNLGATYKILGHYSLALSNYEKSLDISRQMNNQEGIALCLNNIGQIKLEQRDYGQALDYQLKALAIYEQMNYKNGVAFSLIELASIYEAKGQFDKAVFYCKKGLELSKEIHSLIYERDALELLSSIYSKKKDYHSALSYFELFKEREDSLINEENIRKLDEVRFGYQLHKKEAENSQLRQEKALNQAHTEKQQLLVLLIGAGLMLAVVLLLFLWRVIWVSKKENLLIMQQKAQIQEQNAALAALNEEVSQQRDNLLILHEESESQKAQILHQNEELQVTNEKLSELDREKDGLMGVVAHDLKAPLNRTMGLCELIRLKGTLNETQENYLQLIEKMVKDGNQLILDLLTLNRAQQPILSDETTSLNLRQWMDSLIKGYEGQATSKQISLHYRPSKIDFRIEIDERSLSRIMDNLLSNALKFSEPGKKIIVGLNHHNGQMSIFVQDEGPGISMEDQTKLFQKFQRLSAQPTQGESSTGLGLAIVKTLVGKIGGEIKVESEVSKGTRFTVFLPYRFAQVA